MNVIIGQAHICARFGRASRCCGLNYGGSVRGCRRQVGHALRLPSRADARTCGAARVRRAAPGVGQAGSALARVGIPQHVRGGPACLTSRLVMGSMGRVGGRRLTCRRGVRRSLRSGRCAGWPRRSVVPVTLLLPAVKPLLLLVSLLGPSGTGWLMVVPVMCHAPHEVPAAGRKRHGRAPAAGRPPCQAVPGRRRQPEAVVTGADRGRCHCCCRGGLGGRAAVARGPPDDPGGLDHHDAGSARVGAPPGLARPGGGSDRASRYRPARHARQQPAGSHREPGQDHDRVPGAERPPAARGRVRAGDHRDRGRRLGLRQRPAAGPIGRPGDTRGEADRASGAGGDAHPLRQQHRLPASPLGRRLQKGRSWRR